MRKENANEGHVQAIFDGDPAARRVFLRKAAEDGHVPAMYRLALTCDDPAERKRWLREAAHEGYVRPVKEHGPCSF
jgi:TPR repeat protein